MGEKPKGSWFEGKKKWIAGLGLAGALGGAVESGKVGVKHVGAEQDHVEHVEKISKTEVKSTEKVGETKGDSEDEIDITPGDYDADTNEVYEYGKADIPESEQEATKFARNKVLKNENYLTLQKSLRTAAPSFNFTFDTFGEDGSAAGKIYFGTSKKEVYRVAFSNPEAGTCTISMIGEDGKEITGSEEKFNSATDLAKELERRKDSGIFE
jgi:hypothetical protein